MRYEELKPIILAAVAGCFSTVEGIKSFVEPKISAEIEIQDLDDALFQMCCDDDLVRLNNGVFSAYFAYGDEPLKFMRSGNGKITKYYEYANEKDFPVEKFDFYNVESKNISDDYEITIYPYYSPEQLSRIENLIAEGHNKTEVARILAIDEHRFQRRSRSDLATRTAISEGVKRLKPKTPPPAAEPKIKPPENQETPKAPRRVCDLRPLSVVCETTASVAAPTVLSNRRLCKCGDPLGPRKNECRKCWLKLQQGEQDANQSPELDKYIRNGVFKSNLEPQVLSEILLDIFLKEAPLSIKQKFAERLFSEVLDEESQAA